MNTLRINHIQEILAFVPPSDNLDLFLVPTVHCSLKRSQLVFLIRICQGQENLPPPRIPYEASTRHYFFHPHPNLLFSILNLAAMAQQQRRQWLRLV